MKKHSRIISILLAMMMVLSSLSIVFAVDELAEPQDGDQAVVTEEAVEDAADEAAVEAQDVEAAEEAVEEEPVPEPVMVDVTIKYVYEDGKKAADDFVGQVEAGQEYSFPSPKANQLGYAPDKKEIAGIAAEGMPINETVVYAPAATEEVANLQLHPSYLAIVLTWDKNEEAKEYIVQKKNDLGEFEDIAVLHNSDTDANYPELIRWKDYDAKGTEGTFSKAKTYYYKVFSVSETDIRSEVGSSAKGTCVRPMYETITFKKAVTLTSHEGKKKKIKFTKGQTVTAYGFGSGKYRFYYNGYLFYASYVRVKNCKAEYQANSAGTSPKASKGYKGDFALKNYASSDASSFDTATNSGIYKGIRYYDRISAEDFVNDHGIDPPAAAPSSKTQYLIWVSTYQQHLYVFQGSKGNWKLVKDWECATGAAKSPTPTGHGKVIWKKLKKHSGIKYWSPFQTMNSIHGQRSSYTFGAPASNGCVRNYNDNALWVYNNCNTGKDGRKASKANTAVVVW